MSRLIRYPLKRILSLFITLVITTMVLYAAAMITPPETRATLFMPKNLSPHMTEAQYENLIQLKIRENHLNDSYPVQYYYWVSGLIKGNWGYSPTLQEDVLTALIRRTPVTAELTFYSILFFIPLGIIGGVISGSRQHKPVDHSFRLSAYVATSLPPFILALILMAIFYVGLYWFAPERTSTAMSFLINAKTFHSYTGFLTIDGLLNGLPQVTLDAFKHLVMPVFTLAIAHWAILGRVTRATMIEETTRDYTVAAKARGLPRHKIVWGHMLPNAIAPAITSSMLSAASLLTGVFVVEVIFGFHGVSDIAVHSMEGVPDAAGALGFTIYSVIVVSILMAILDFIQTATDPRIREGGGI